MTRYILSICLCLFYFSSMAHQPAVSSTILVEQENNKWLLQIRSPLAAFEYQVKEHFGDNAFSTPEEFQQLTIDLLKENISIYFNESDTISLHNGFVKLGHETNVVFQVSGVPNTINSIYVKNSNFKDIRKNQSTLVVLKKDFVKKQFVLNNANKHAVQLKAENSKFILISEPVIAPKNDQSGLFALTGISILILISAAFAYYLHVRQRNHSYQNLKLSVAKVIAKDRMLR